MPTQVTTSALLAQESSRASITVEEGATYAPSTSSQSQFLTEAESRCPSLEGGNKQHSPQADHGEQSPPSTLVRPASSMVDRSANDQSRDTDGNSTSEPPEPLDAGEIERHDEVDNVLEMSDPASFIKRRVDPILRHNLIMKGANQPKEKEVITGKFPRSKFGSKYRSFSDSWYFVKVGEEKVHRNWLSYSPKEDAAFCHNCIFFGGKNKEVAFTQVGCRNWKDAHERFSKHERSQAHVDATLDFVCYCSRTSIDQQLSAEAARLEWERHKQVEQNRNTMKRLTDITIFLAKQGLALRGHREDMSMESANKGNFIATAEFLSKYDEAMASHLSKVKKERMKRKEDGKPKGKKKAKRGRGNIITFMSAESQNKIIDIVGNDVIEMVLKEIKAAVYFSIAMDCTTDISHKDQLSIIIRYLDGNLDITERLLCVERVKDSSAEGLFNKLKDCFEKKEIRFDHAVGQSYDGASVMKGKYNGVKTKVQRVAPQCLFIWTFDHVLNLVIMEACCSSLAAKSLFGVLEKVYAFFSASRKRSDILEEKQKKSSVSPIHRPQRVSTTRWWSHQKALNNVFFACSEALYDCFIDALQDCQSADQSVETITDAEALEHKLTSFELVLTAHLFRHIFAITDPASLYLQSEKIDLLTAIRLVETAQTQLQQLRSKFTEIHAEAKSYCTHHQLQEQDFIAKRTRRRKRQADEICQDEVEENIASRYRRETFIFAIDTAVSSIRRRFTSHKAILQDVALLDPERFHEALESRCLPPEAFQNVAKNYGLEARTLAEEYLSFIDNYSRFKEVNGICQAEKETTNKDVDRESFLTVVKAINRFNVQSAYPNLYTLYKIIATLPIGSTKCERTFSKLKYVKNRLRSTMGQERLNALMMINIERDLTEAVSFDAVIDKFADTPLLRKLLMH